MINGLRKTSGLYCLKLTKAEAIATSQLLRGVPCVAPFVAE